MLHRLATLDSTSTFSKALSLYRTKRFSVFGCHPLFSQQKHRVCATNRLCISRPRVLSHSAGKSGSSCQASVFPSAVQTVGAEGCVTPSCKMRLIDIGANLVDPMYQGQYHGKQYHEPDLPEVLERAWGAGLERIIITATNLDEGRAALVLARTDERLFCTVGVHPTRCGEFDDFPAGPAAYMAALAELIDDGTADGKVVAVGEFGLDYDRLQFCDKETQRKFFEQQFTLAADSGLPLFLHCRAAAADFHEILMRQRNSFSSGVVHSFDGTAEELTGILQFDNLCVGINGCSLKAEENLGVMAAIPLERLMIETDSPWCEPRPTHASKPYVKTSHPAKDKKKYAAGDLVKGRNEPCNLVQVLEIIGGKRGLQDLDSLADQIRSNTMRVFFPSAAH